MSSEARLFKSQKSDCDIERSEKESEHSEFTVMELRQTLHRSFINMFSELNKMACSPGDTVPPNFSKFIQCFRYCLEGFPQIFVPSLPTNGSSSTSLRFTEWLMMQLLKVLSHQYPAVVHDDCEDLFVSLFQVVRTSSPVSFRKFALFLISTLSDLLCFWENPDVGCNNKFLIQSSSPLQKDNVMEVDDSLDLSNNTVSISNVVECEHMLVKTINLVKKLGGDLVLFLPDQRNSVWKHLCQVVENGNPVLKEASLSSIMELVLKTGLPMSYLLVNYILDCLCASVSYCLFCKTECDNQLSFLEKAVASCLVCVSNELYARMLLNASHGFSIVHILTAFMKVVIKYGMAELKEANLHSAVMKTIVSLIKCLNVAKVELPFDTVLSFQANLLQNVGEPYLNDILTPVLLCLIECEVKQSFHSWVSGKASFLHPPSDIECGKQWDSSWPVYLKMNSLSFTWASVFDVLLQTLKKTDSLEMPSIETKIFSMTTCLSVLLHSSFSYVMDSSKNFAELCDLHSSSSISYHLPNDILTVFIDYILKLGTSGHLKNVFLYKEVMTQCCCLMSFKDFLPLTPSECNGLAHILSFPWTLDINADSFDHPVYLALTNSELFQTEIKVQCLKTIAIIQENFRKEWCSAFLYKLSECDNSQLKKCMVELLPYFFYIGVSHDVLEEILKKVVCDDVEDVLENVPGALGKINCIFHSKCLLCRCKQEDGNFKFFPEIMCKICDMCCDSVNTRLNVVSPSWLISLFANLLCHANAVVKKECVMNMKRVFSHGDINKGLLSSLLTCLVDPNLEVRISLRSVVQHIFKPWSDMSRSSTWSFEIEEILITKLKGSLCIAKRSGNVCIRESVLCTISELGKVANHGILLICIISLLDNFLCSVPSIIAVAHLSMKEIAVSKKHKMSDLLKIYIDPICKFLATSLLSAGPENEAAALLILQKISSIFGYSDLKLFLSVIQQHFLPYLVRYETEGTPILVKLLSSLLATNKRDLLLNNFPFIFSHLVCHCKKEKLETSLTYVQKETELVFGSLLRCNYQHIHNELLLNIGTHYEEVFSGLATLASESKNLCQGEHILMSREAMANYLQPKLLGFLVYLDSRLLRSSITLEDKKLFLQSLIRIMELMGPRHITTVRFKVMATLRIALRFKESDFPKICCQAWNTFVHSIEISSLGPLLNQIVVTLLPLLELEPEAVSNILSFLIIQYQNPLKEFFHDLYFIPATNELQAVHAVLKDYTEDPSSQADFQTVLSHSLKGVSHENLEVRLHALDKLKQVLNMNQVSLCDHLLGREPVDHLLCHLVAVVMPNCRESNVRARLLLGECLGSLGALDPGRLEMKSIKSKENYDFLSSVKEDNFAFALIKELAHSFLAATDCRVQDCSAFAIQEALQIYKCSDYEHSSSRKKLPAILWNRFSPEVQEILEVLSHSQYKPLEKIKQLYPSPIYKSSFGQCFNDWVTNWFTNLLQHVKQDMAAKLFHSCSIIIKFDLNCALFLLPHVILYAILDACGSKKEEIVSEILVVLNDSEKLSSDLSHLSSQTVFSIIDYLVKWAYWKQKQVMSAENTGRSGVPRPVKDASLSAVQSFLCSVPQILLAKSSYCCHAYTRALMHLEQHLNEHSSELKNNTSFLQKLYSALDESDGVSGVAVIRNEEPSLKDAILEHEATGDMQAALACYEKAINVFPDEVSYYGGLLNSFLRMDQSNTALSYATGILHNRPGWFDDLNLYRVEAAWKLAEWESLHSFLENEPPSDKWNVGIGKILLCAHSEDFIGFQEQIKTMRCSQMAPLSAASMENGAYLRAYEHLTRLHMLTDIERSIKLFTEGLTVSSLDSVLEEWKMRRHLIQSSLRYQEPVLDIHRALLNMCKKKYRALCSKLEHEIASCWLESAKLARKSGHHQRAYSCLVEASAMKSPVLFIEKAKWHWNKSEKEQAINCLKKGIEQHFLIDASSKATSSDVQCAKAKLLLSMYTEESATADSNRLIQMYQEIVNLQPQWEESHFHLAKYYDKLFNAMDRCENKIEIMLNIAKGFANSLTYGCKHIYHSLPRLLDIWFDMGTLVVEQADASSKKGIARNMESALAQLTNVIIAQLCEKLPMCLFMTAFPQLISRICHSHTEVFFQLQALIVKLLAAHSQQSIWMMIAVSKSSYPMRVQRCRKIFHAAISEKPELNKFIHDTTRLADKLIELSNKSITESNSFNINEQFQSLPKMVQDRNFSSIMLPLQTQMIVTLPSGHVSSCHHNPFPFTPICIQGFKETVEIFQSLQRPKKLVIKGSDGKEYGIICKPKDDLRKDCRLMEFNNLVNRYLKSDPEARKRQLYIRTYAVVPLNEECGLIEWVPNLSGLRLILLKIYKYKGLHVSGKEIKCMMAARTASPEQKLHIFKTKFLPRFPPVFSEWFLSSFPDPTTWYLARLAYARTTSVMSMVGYIVGLGDRHGENILFDSSCGDTVHVDLNCLFNKGETMECPECVPFRLTHNMVHAMGPTGYEGVFRKACEVTMRVMRSQTDALMSVLRPFVHDPLVEWSKTSRGSRHQAPTTGEIRNEMGLTHVKDIELRLNGIIKSKNKSKGLPLSIEGQVDYLIQEATDQRNLSQMYIGWAPYL